MFLLRFDIPASAAYGATRAALKKTGTPIGALDTLTAAHAKSLHLTLVNACHKQYPRASARKRIVRCGLVGLILDKRLKDQRLFAAGYKIPARLSLR
jgi:hypothetical protein